MEQNIPKTNIITDNNNNNNENIDNPLDIQNGSKANDNNINYNNDNKLDLLAIPIKGARLSTMAPQFNKIKKSETIKINKNTINESIPLEQNNLKDQINNQNNIDNHNDNKNNPDDETNQIKNLKEISNCFVPQNHQIKITSLIQKIDTNKTSKISSKKMANTSSNKLLKTIETCKSKLYGEILKGKSVKNTMKITTFEQRLNKIETKFNLDKRNCAETTPSKLDIIKEKELEYNIGWLFYTDQLKIIQSQSTLNTSLYIRIGSYASDAFRYQIRLLH